MKKTFFIIILLAFGLAGFSQTTWTGAEDTDWNNTQNWSTNSVPTASDDVIIPDVSAGSNRYPVIASNTTDAVCKNLLISPGASLTIDADKKLIYRGHITVNGTFTVNGTLLFTQL